MKKKGKVFIIVLTIFFLWCLIGAFVAFPPAIVVVIALYVLLLIFPKNKAEVEKAGERARKAIDYAGTWGKEIGKTGAAISVVTGIAIKGTIEEFYKRIGGEEGVKKAIEVLGKLAETTGKICVEAVIVGRKAVAAVTEYTMERIEEEKAQLNEREIKLLNDNVTWKIITDKEESKYTNFVNNGRRTKKSLK